MTGRGGRVEPEGGRRVGHGDGLEQAVVEVRRAAPQRGPARRRFGRRADRLAERRPDPLGDEGEPRLGLERVVGVAEGVVERRRRRAGAPGRRRRARRPPARSRRSPRTLGLEVEDPLAIAAGRAGRPSWTTCGGRSDDRRPLGRTLVPIEVVADRAVVDDEQRPRRRGCGAGRRARRSARGGPRERPATGGFQARTVARRRRSRRRRPSQDRTRPRRPRRPTRRAWSSSSRSSASRSRAP